MPSSIGVGLKEDTSSSMFGGIRSEGERFPKIGEAKDWFLQESGLELVKSQVARRGPFPSKIFLGKVDQGASDGGIISNEFSVIIGETEEGSDVLDRFRDRPVLDPFEFGGIHRDLPWGENHSQEIY